MKTEDYLKSKGIHSLETKKRYQEVNSWLNEFAQQQACAFSEWAMKNWWEYSLQAKMWVKDKDMFTTEQLYQQFLQEGGIQHE